MLTMIGIVAFIVGILFSIGWHELGHMIPAKKFGVKVTQYMIGFGPTIWSRKRGDTEYGVKAIPLGGYIRMIGMFPPGPDGKVRANSTGRLSAMIEDARKQAQEEVTNEEDLKRTFYKLSVPKKVTVMLGGPVMNLILAAILFTVLFVGFGMPTTSTVVEKISPCVPTAASATGACAPGSVPSPAQAAGLAPGDEIVSYNAHQISSWSQASQLIRSSPAGPATMVVIRDGQPITLRPDVLVMSRAVVSNGQATDAMAPQGFIGITPTIELTPQPITSVPAEMWGLTVRSATALVQIPVRMVGVAKAAFGSGERDPNGPIGIVGVTRLSGEVANAENIPAEWKIAQFVGLLASLNLFLFLFNLVPLLPLDGGHVVGALWEGLRRQIAKLRQRPDPGPVDVARALPLAYGVALLLIGMSAVLLYADLVKPVRIGG